MTSGRAQRVTALVTAVAVLLFGLLPVLLTALYFAALQCDETCESKSGWQADQGAWQWQAQLVIALVGIAASAVGVRRAWRGAWGAFWPAAAIAVPSYAAWAVFVSG